MKSKDLKIKSVEYRKTILDIIYNGGAGHTAGSLSCIDILNVLYNNVLNINPKNFNTIDRNRYIQSKGHSVEALYTVLCDKGFYDRSELNNLNKFNSHFIGHPTRKIPGIEHNTGALGHGISVAVGIAIAYKLSNKNYKVYTLLGEVIEMDTDSIGFGERESNIDIVKVLSQYLDCLVLRNNDHEIIKQLADINSIPIINGLSNYSHPCQILSDIFTIEEKKGPITNLVISWSGDINNVLISLAQASKILDFRLNVACPEKILNQKKHFLENFNENIVFFQNPMEAVKDSDCIMTDVWCSMGDKSNDLELFRDFQINKNVMNASKQDSIFMHCLPAKRNQEVTDEVIDSERSIVWKQAYNRMLVQQGILSYCIE